MQIRFVRYIKNSIELGQLQRPQESEGQKILIKKKLKINSKNLKNQNQTKKYKWGLANQLYKVHKKINRASYSDPQQSEEQKCQ